MISTLQICCVLKISAEIQIQYQKLPLTAKRFCCKPIIYIGLVFAVDISLPQPLPVLSRSACIFNSLCYDPDRNPIDFEH